MHLEQKLAKILIKQKKTLAAAESCTGGLLADLLTNIPGSSAFFWLGLVVYDNKAKEQILKVSPSIIKQKGAVSEETAIAMAKNVRELLKTDLGIGITGIAGPGGGSKDKPVGLVFIALASSKNTLVEKFLFKGPRLKIKRQSAQAALRMLLKSLG
jgi:nicotinamide-nucleotide amidase